MKVLHKRPAYTYSVDLFICFSLFYFSNVSSNFPTDPLRLAPLFSLVYRWEAEAQRAERGESVPRVLSLLLVWGCPHPTCSHALIQLSSMSYFIPPWTDRRCNTSSLMFFLARSLLCTESHGAFVNCELSTNIPTDIPTSHRSLFVFLWLSARAPDSDTGAVPMNILSPMLLQYASF